MTENYLEPWRTQRIRSSLDKHTTVTDAVGNVLIKTGYDYGTAPEVVRRIVACVNACAGVPTDVLERLTPGSLHLGTWYP